MANVKATSDVLYISTKKYVAALDSATGQEIWRTKLPDVTASVISLLIRGGRVYAGTYGHVFAIDRATGEILWMNELPKMGYQHVILAMEGTDSSVQSTVAQAEVMSRRQAAAAAGAAGAAAS